MFIRLRVILRRHFLATDRRGTTTASTGASANGTASSFSFGFLSYSKARARPSSEGTWSGTATSSVHGVRTPRTFRPSPSKDPLRSVVLKILLRPRLPRRPPRLPPLRVERTLQTLGMYTCTIMSCLNYCGRRCFHLYHNLHRDTCTCRGPPSSSIRHNVPRRHHTHYTIPACLHNAVYIYSTLARASYVASVRLRSQMFCLTHCMHTHIAGCNLHSISVTISFHFRCRRGPTRPHVRPHAPHGSRHIVDSPARRPMVGLADRPLVSGSHRSTLLVHDVMA